MYTDDPVRDFEAHDAKQQEWLESRPVCEHCGKHIQDDYFYIIFGEYMCKDCLNSAYRKRTEDYER